MSNSVFDARLERLDLVSLVDLRPLASSEISVKRGFLFLGYR
jgi:hypothetical protein